MLGLSFAITRNTQGTKLCLSQASFNRMTKVSTPCRKKFPKTPSLNLKVTLLSLSLSASFSKNIRPGMPWMHLAR
jgi:hypothetical protein